MSAACERCGDAGYLAAEGYRLCPLCAVPKAARQVVGHLGLSAAQVNSSYATWDIIHGEPATVAARRALLSIGRATVAEITTESRFAHLKQGYERDEQPTGPPLLLYIGGGLGAGKSYFCEATVNELAVEYFMAGAVSYDCYRDTRSVGFMVTEAELDGALKARIQTELRERTEQYLDRLSSYGLLIIDDAGVLEYSEYTRGCLWRIFERRYTRRLPMWFTGNLPIKDYLYHVFGEGLSQRFYDRFQHVGQVITLGGASRRPRIYTRKDGS